MSEMVLGEAVIVKQEYSLFDNEVEGEEGIFVRVDSTTNKSLVYFPQFKEWAEIEHLERVEEGVVPEKNKSFAENVRELNYTMERSFFGFNNGGK
jgi:hypothetical protein